MALRDLFRRRTPEAAPRDDGTQELRNTLGQAEGYERIRPGNQIIQQAGPGPVEDGDIGDESAVRTSGEEDALRMGQRMGANMMLRARGVDTSEYGQTQDRGIITRDHVRKAYEDLMKYRQGKYSVERRIIKSQEWWKLCNWDIIEIEKAIRGTQPIQSSTPWLFHSIARKHAEMMDSFPEAIILPQAADDVQTAQQLNKIIPVILKKCDFEETYDEMKYQKILEGTEAVGVFWDKDLCNGLGDVSIKKINMLNLFWQPGVEKIEDSKQIFYTYLENNDELLAAYPQLEGKLGGDAYMQAEYRLDDAVPHDDKSIVVDWYYKRRINGKDIVHLCTFCAGEILSSTENMGMDEGLYIDGEYPFVVGQMYKVAGSLAGYGMVDFEKDTQTDIDTMSSAMVLNTVVNATPRHFVKNGGGVNEQEYANVRNPFVHVTGNLGEDAIRPIQSPAMNGYCMNMLQFKVDELKFASGDTDVNNGGVPAGVTAASAIAALHEQNGLTTKDNIRGDYRVFSKVVKKVLSRATQGYDVARTFRITGTNGQNDEFVQFDNSGLKPQPIQGAPGLGLEEGYRIPEWDIDIRVQRENAYTRLSNNEMALQFYQLGFFNPQNAMQAMMALDMMDFKGKEEIIRKVQKNDQLLTAFMQVSQIALALAQQFNPEMADRLAGIIQQVTGAATGQAITAGGGTTQAGLPSADNMGNEEAKKANPLAERAAERAANATRPT